MWNDPGYQATYQKTAESTSHRAKRQKLQPANALETMAGRRELEEVKGELKISQERGSRLDTEIADLQRKLDEQTAFVRTATAALGMIDQANKNIITPLAQKALDRLPVGVTQADDSYELMDLQAEVLSEMYHEGAAPLRRLQWRVVESRRIYPSSSCSATQVL